MDSMNINCDKIKSSITPQTSAILAVHVFGTPCDVISIQKIADQAGIRVIYDAAHAFDIDLYNTGIGNFGDISMFSLHATKIFHTAEGGLLTFKEPNYKTMIDLMRNFGIKNEEEILFPGINGKMTELQAALGLLVLEDLQGEINKRKKLYETYFSCLKGLGGINIQSNNSEIKPNYQYCVIRIDEERFGYSRDAIYVKLREYNVYARKYFYPLCSDYEFYKHLPSADPAHLVVSQKVAKEVLTMPLYGELTTYDVEKICEILHNLKK
jgi:dTDP-4-amino-4,6-dideoxygalactose transaminase